MCTVVQFREYDQWTSLILFFAKINWNWETVRFLAMGTIIIFDSFSSPQVISTFTDPLDNPHTTEG